MINMSAITKLTSKSLPRLINETQGATFLHLREALKDSAEDSEKAAEVKLVYYLLATPWKLAVNRKKRSPFHLFTYK